MTTIPATTKAKPTFLYDDCCPLCRGYTATFTALGWADRAPFSGIDSHTLDALDMDRARHHIPLHDPESETTQYGLDGILDVVTHQAPLLGKFAQLPPMRALLDRFYWFITYNRRHIVTAAPPATGVDCAPDFEPTAVATYVATCSATTTAIAAGANLAVPLAGVAGAAAYFVHGRTNDWQINPLQAVGHATSVVTASAIVGGVATACKAPPAVTVAAIAATALRKMHLRRWMRGPRPTTKPLS